MCDQQSLRSACTYAQSDQSYCQSLEYSMTVKLLTEHYLEFLSLKGGCRGLSQSTHVKMPHCWKSHALAHMKEKCQKFTYPHMQLLYMFSFPVYLRCSQRHFLLEWGCYKIWFLFVHHCHKLQNNHRKQSSLRSHHYDLKQFNSCVNPCVNPLTLKAPRKKAFENVFC